ncbi:MAG: hypothetical protein PF448_13670 [Bacteroidales bacterium]|jgi:hypothetical protein|nr:hypothetical protein [Bacteroidales bacterium]
MLNLNPYSGATMAYHKSSAYHHKISLLDRALKSTYINDIEISNSSDFIADKAVVLLHLNQNISPENFKITECKAQVDAQVYPNGIIQLNFDQLQLKPGDTMHCTYRFKLSGTETEKEALVKKTYLFFFQ